MIQVSDNLPSPNLAEVEFFCPKRADIIDMYLCFGNIMGKKNIKWYYINKCARLISHIYFDTWIIFDNVLNKTP